MSSFPLTNSIIFQRGRAQPPYGKSPFSMGKSTISMAIFQFAMLQITRGYIYIYTYIYHQTAHSIPNFLTALLKQRGEAQQIPERRHDVQLLNDTILSIKVGKKGAIVEDPNQLLGAVVS